MDSREVRRADRALIALAKRSTCCAAPCPDPTTVQGVPVIKCRYCGAILVAGRVPVTSS